MEEAECETRQRNQRRGGRGKGKAAEEEHGGVAQPLIHELLCARTMMTKMKVLKAKTIVTFRTLWKPIIRVLTTTANGPSGRSSRSPRSPRSERACSGTAVKGGERR